MSEKKTYLSGLMFDNLKKTNKKNQWSRFGFISVGVRAVKNLRQYKKFNWDQFVKKKKTISQNFS